MNHPGENEIPSTFAPDVEICKAGVCCWVLLLIYGVLRVMITSLRGKGMGLEWGWSGWGQRVGGPCPELGRGCKCWAGGGQGTMSAHPPRHWFRVCRSEKQLSQQKPLPRATQHDFRGPPCPSETRVLELRMLPWRLPPTLSCSCTQP